MKFVISFLITLFCLSAFGLDAVQKISVDAASTNIPSGSYLELDASLDAKVNYIEVANSTTQTCYLAVGAASSEQDLKMYLFPYGFQRSYVKIAKGVRLSARCIAAATTGRLSLNFYQ